MVSLTLFLQEYLVSSGAFDADSVYKVQYLQYRIDKCNTLLCVFINNLPSLITNQ